MLFQFVIIIVMSKNRKDEVGSQIKLQLHSLFTLLLLLYYINLILLLPLVVAVFSSMLTQFSILSDISLTHSTQPHSLTLVVIIPPLPVPLTFTSVFTRWTLKLNKDKTLDSLTLTHSLCLTHTSISTSSWLILHSVHLWFTFSSVFDSLFHFLYVIVTRSRFTHQFHYY